MVGDEEVCVPGLVRELKSVWVMCGSRRGTVREKEKEQGCVGGSRLC